MTKLAGYSLCLSVIASVIPKSIKTALATILPPIVLGTDALAVLPSSVVHLRIKLSSLRLINGELGISTSIEILLLLTKHSPELPSLKDNATGTYASFVMDAQLVNAGISKEIKNSFFMITTCLLDLTFKKIMVERTGIEPVTPTMSTWC